MLRFTETGETMRYSISGHIRLDGARPFHHEVEAQSEKHAREKTYALFGSRNGLLRTAISIEKVVKIGSA